MKAISWRELNKQIEIYKNGWITLIFRDVFGLISKAELKRMHSKYKPLNLNMSYCQMMWYSFFRITNEQILERCGLDALDYLRFLKCTIVYNIINSLVVLLCVLPANLQGYLERHRSLFVRTTIANIDFSESYFLWVHVCVTLFLMIICVLQIRSFSSNLIYERSPRATKTVILREMGHKEITSERIEKYIGDIMPGAEIEDIKFVYKYNKLIQNNRRLLQAEEALEICKHIRDVEHREVYVKEKCWCCRFFCKWPCTGLIDGIPYYENRVTHAKIMVAEELNRLPWKPLRYVFLTFKHDYLAFQARAKNVRYPDIKDDKYWRIQSAPNPGNIIWENLSRKANLSCSTLFINTAVFLIAVFLTTPAIVLSSSNLEQINSQLSDKGAFVRFIPTLIVWIISVAIPALVTYSSGFLDFETKSGLNRSIMMKTVIFLIFTVVLLPSLGLASMSAFFIWSLQPEEAGDKWGCIFLPDNGSFFVSYVMTSAFIGNTIQLLRLSEIFFCLVGVLTAKSEVEKIPIRKKNIMDFSYGVQYGYCLLIFTLILFFSVLCPVIAPFGLAYFVLKLFVDRYNIYFSCSPSHASFKVHSLAIQFMMLAVILKSVGLFFLISVRGGRSEITYASQALVWIIVLIYIVTMNPCHLNCIPSCFVMPHLLIYNTYNVVKRVPTEKEVFFPFALMKYIDQIPAVDKYGNPLVSGSLSEEDIISQDFLDALCN